MNQENKSDLHEMLETVQRNVSDFPMDNDAAHVQSGFGPGSIRFVGRSLELYYHLTTQLAGSALDNSGRVPDAVENLLIQFVRQADGTSESDAITWLEAELARPPESWTIAQEFRVRLPMGMSRMTIGSCTIVNSLNDVGESGAHTYAPTTDKWRAPFIFTTVHAPDQDSARILSRERFSETEAIALALARSVGVPGARYLSVDSPTNLYSSGHGAVAVIGAVDRAGALLPGYRELSDAAALDVDSRSDWERRVLSSIRWFGVATRTHWPSQAISGAMSCLECLLVLPGESNKRKPISERLTEIVQFKGMTSDEQRDWIKSLYGRRNDAVHAGNFFQNELTAKKLNILVHRAVHWAIQHLDPFHRDEGTACPTIDEAIAPHD